MSKITRKRIILGSCLIVVLIAAIFVVLKITGTEAKFVEVTNEQEIEYENSVKMLKQSLKEDKESLALIGDEISKELSVYELSHNDFLRYELSKYSLGKENIDVVPENSGSLNGNENAVNVGYKESAIYKVNMTAEGLYNAKLDYFVEGNSLSNLTVEIKINGETLYKEMRAIDLPMSFSDKTKEFPKDTYGDEAVPPQIRNISWQTEYLFNNKHDYARPLELLLKEGENTIEIINSSQPVQLGVLSIVPVMELPSYDEYIKKYNDVKKYNGELINVDAVSYSEKNSTSVSLYFVMSPSVSPVDPIDKKINVIDFMKAGTMATYEVEAPEDGLYALTIHYATHQPDFSAFYSVLVDGEVPFNEALSFTMKESDKDYVNTTIADKDGNPYFIYLSKGKHTLSFRNENNPVYDVKSDLQLLVDHINKFTLDVKKITGKKIDRNRTWNFTKYIPETVDFLNAYRSIIEYNIYRLQQFSTLGVNAESIFELQRALIFLDKISEYPNDLPLNLDSLSAGSSSVLQFVGGMLSTLDYQYTIFDSFYLHGDTNELPKADSSLAEEFKFGIDKLLATFTTKKYVVVNDEEALNIWVNRAITHVDTLQKMIDSDYVSLEGRKVKLSLMPDQNKLIMAHAANNAPDIALGLQSHIPFELSSRTALYDLSQFEDFWEVMGRFPAGSIVPFVFNEGVYAIPETVDFNALVYRTDVFNELGLEPPDTWQDVIDILPELQRYGMNFYHPISTGEGYKWYYQTAGMIFQTHGKLYSDDGKTALLNTPDSIKGISFLGELFTAYSLPEQVPSFFNSFVYSDLPVGIITLDSYMLIKNAAPELAGQWALADNPGTVQEDGSIERWFMANGTNGVIMSSSEKIDEAWNFLKWWTSHETQSNYQYSLISSFGPNYLWFSANLDSMQDMPIDTADKRIITDQVKWLRDVPRTPGQYMVERGLSDIWNDIVFKGVSPQVATDKRIIMMQREMRRKMQEFGFIDADGNTLKPYQIHDIDWIQQKIDEGGGAK